MTKTGPPLRCQNPACDRIATVHVGKHHWCADHDLPQCMLCDEAMAETSASEIQPIHRSCALRSVVGGIGHCIAHEYWCVVRKDPDAGLTYRQSARLVDAYVQVMGVPPPGAHR